MAATQDSPVQGGALLAVYALGMAAPMFLLALLWDRFELGRRRWLRGRMLAFGPVRVHSTSLVSGVLFVVIGALFLRFDGTAGITGVLGLGDTSDLEFTAQQAVGDLASAIPAWTVPAVVALLATTVAWRRTHRAPPSGSHPSELDGSDSDPTDSDPSDVRQSSQEHSPT